MSLKAFHLVFVTASTLLCLGLAGWGVWMYLKEGGAVYLAYAAGAMVAAGVLVRYGKYFLKKLKDFSYL